MAIGVQQRGIVCHDADVTVPEHQVATGQAVEVVDHQVLAEALFLHVAIAQRLDTGGLQRHLHEARAIETVGRLAAPVVRHAEEAFGDRHIVARLLRQRGEVSCPDKAVIGKLGELPILTRDRHFGEHWQPCGGLGLDRRGGVAEGRWYDDLVGRGQHLAQRFA